MVGFTILLVLACGSKAPSPTGLGDDAPQDTASAIDCIPEGGEFWGKSYSDYCCDGLMNIPMDPYPCDAGQEPAPPDMFWCAACGDAECGLMETFCNCPEDCEDGEVGPTE
jgi:hypothetical protein